MLSALPQESPLLIRFDDHERRRSPCIPATATFEEFLFGIRSMCKDAAAARPIKE